MKKNEIKLKKSICYSLFIKGAWTRDYFLKSYKGYNFIIDNIKFDIFKGQYGWQVNWQGLLIENYETLKKLKNAILEDRRFINLIEQIKQGKIQPNPKYLELINQMEAKNEI